MVFVSWHLSHLYCFGLVQNFCMKERTAFEVTGTELTFELVEEEFIVESWEGVTGTELTFELLEKEFILESWEGVTGTEFTFELLI